MRDPDEGMDADGCIVTGVRRDRVPGPFVPIVDAAIAAVADCTAVEPSSLHLYGSVATGMARSPASDVDLLVIGMDPDAAAGIARRLSGDFASRCRSVDVAVEQPSDLEGDSDAAYGNRVFLRHYCAHLCGPEVRLAVPVFRADRRAARGFNGDLARHARRWRSDLEDGADLSELARRLARKSLLAVAGLVSVHDATWTTDRQSAAQRWSEIEPQWATHLQVLIDWSDAAVDVEAHQVRSSLDGVVAHLIESFDAAIGLWETGWTTGHRVRSGTR
jgi:hypothetical protein